MQLEIKETKQKPIKNKNLYRIKIEFEDGHNDRPYTEKIDLPDKYFNMENVREIFLKGILVIYGCLAAYPKGKGGYEGYSEVPNYNDFFYCENDTDANYEPKVTDKYESILEKYMGGYFGHPCGEDTIPRFESCEIFHYDENGNKSEVTVTFNDEDLQYIELCKNIV